MIAYPVNTALPVASLARKTRADVARHGGVVLVGRPSQARQLRRLRGELRAAGYEARYWSDGAARHVLTVGREPSRVAGWWGAAG